MTRWRKSSYSGGGEGNDCVEVAATPTRILVRDSKMPTEATLSLPTGVFALFLEALKPADGPAYAPNAARTARTNPCARGSAVTVLRKPFVT
ncbi:hypothetical protein C6Y14_06810 [Streptomyces dioscori]|uniref:DUF397 domain-containing protein n=1 Tax=Streptomyces dioscori TaxID=2109333 RepID=A0A2P8QCU0_9ACTN|nr:hypothetical protein C6Y14_06810 [Streptomyces dioscori]